MHSRFLGLKACVFFPFVFFFFFLFFSLSLSLSLSPPPPFFSGWVGFYCRDYLPVSETCMLLLTVFNYLYAVCVSRIVCVRACVRVRVCVRVCVYGGARISKYTSAVQCTIVETDSTILSFCLMSSDAKEHIRDDN